MKNFFINLTVATTTAIAVFLIGFSVGLVRVTFTEATPVLVQDATASVMINNGETVLSYSGLDLPAEPTVLGLLEYVADSERFVVDIDDSSSLGAFVKQIGEKKNGQNGYYWQYWVNGGQPLVASDKYILQGGETILWTFSKSAM